MIDFRKVPLAEVARLVRDAEVSAVELVEHTIRRIEAANPTLNAFVDVDGDAAVAAAADVDVRVARGGPLGPLAGIPVGVKDTEDAAGFRTTFGSMLYADDPPAARDCVLVQRLKRAGAIVVGKTNTSEFAFAADTTNDVFGTTESLRGQGLTAGGSSGGSAVAVAAGMVPLATGSDGGGSIRLPASVSGLPGFKPSLGRVPHGDRLPPDWPSLSTRGLIAADVGSTTLAYDTVVGPHPRDLRSLPPPHEAWYDAVQQRPPQLPRRLGWTPDLGYARTDPRIRQICEAALEDMAGAYATEVVEVPPLATEPPALHWLTIAATGTMHRVHDVVGTERWELIGSGIRHLLSRFGRPSAEHLQAAEERCHHLASGLADTFQSVDLLLCPVAANEPPDHASARDGAWVELTYPFNMTRSPAGCVPVGVTRSGAPVSIQVIGPHLADADVLRALHAIALAIDPDR